MAARDYILNNFRWKLLALGLAVVAGFSIQSAKNRTIDSVVLHDQPLQVLRPPGDSTIYRVIPPTVNLTLRAESATLLSLSPRDVFVFVNLAAVVPEVPDIARRILILAPQGVSVRSDNIAVSVAKLLPSVESLTNNFDKP